MKTTTFCRIAILAGIFILMCFPAIAIADASDTDDNVFVSDVCGQFENLKHHGEALGWMNPEDEGAPDPSSFDHYQGLVRYPGEGTPIFYVTQKDDDDDILPGASDKGGYLHVIRFGSRSTDGERLRSNLQVIGKGTAETCPNEIDTWLKKIRFDGSLSIDGTFLPAYEHPGGMAIIEDILFMALDTPRSDSSPKGQIVLFDLSDREDPNATQAIELNHKIDNLAVIKQNDDYIVWVNGDGGDETKFYKTTQGDLRDNALGLSEIQDWNPDSSEDYDGDGDSWPTGTGAHQSSAFIRGTGGSLYLIGMRHPGGLPWSGSDYADLYRVDSKSDGGFKLTRLLTKHFYCVYDGGESGGVPGSDMRIGNFAAAGNAYVSPSGELILYSIPHDDEDWADPDFTKLGEFRHRDVNREDSPLRLPSADADGPYTVNEGETVTLSGLGKAPVDRPWIELYDDDNWEDRSIVVDYDDRNKLELNNFNNLDHFNDKCTAIRWRSPGGLNIHLYDDDNYKDRYIILYGTGKTQSIADLKNQVVDTGFVEQQNPDKNPGEKLDFNDKTSSMSFVGSLPSYSPEISWDLDGDSLFGETGASALCGDEVGSNPVFDASDLDGHSIVSVTLKVYVSGLSATDTTFITVNNVAPTVTAEGETIDENGIATVSGTIFDPCTNDTFTVIINWGEGTPETFTYPAGTTSYNETHQYLDDNPTDTPWDEYDINVTVTDDDGGVGTANTTVTVNNVAPAVTAIGDTVDENGTATVNGTIYDPGTYDTFTVEIDWGEGTPETYNYNNSPYNVSIHYNETHQYRDDNPTGTSSDNYEISVTVTDDDGGVGTDDTTVTVNNVAPVTNIDSITDENGAEIGIEVPVTLISLTVNVAGSFTDVGTRDTHNASMDWDDGTSDDLGVVSGITDASHIYADPGNYTMTLAVTDDDTGVDTATALITVVDDEGAVATAIQELTPLADDPNIAAALNKLNGALEKLEEGKLEEDKLIAGLGMIKQALEYLEAAEAANPNLDLTDIKGLLALTAKSVAVGAIEQAETLATKPNELQKIEQAKVLVAEGDALRTAADYAGAVEKYQQAVRELPGIQLPE